MAGPMRTRLRAEAGGPRLPKSEGGVEDPMRTVPMTDVGEPRRMRDRVDGAGPGHK